MAAPLLILQSIRLSFGGTPLLTEAELAVGAGERLCLVGRNGSGKSTLLKIAAGLIEPDAGRRFLQPDANLRYLPQEPDFSGFATALDYVEAGLSPDDGRHRGRALLNELGLSGDENPALLSGGEARRAALARVLAPEPDILLLDEPTNHLDLPAIEWLEAELAGLRSALVLISHDRRFLHNLTRQTRLARSRHAPRRSIAASPNSRPGATRCSRRRNSSSTSWSGRSRPKSIGCATASPRGASATRSGSPSSRDLRKRSASSAARVGQREVRASEADARPASW